MTEKGPGPATSLHGHIAASTVTAPDLRTAEAFYRDVLGYAPAHRGRIAAPLAAAWGAPAQAGTRYVALAPTSGRMGIVRLVERIEPPKPYRPVGTFGWLALEITVQDADALHRRLADDSRVEILGPPRELEFTDRIYPMQAVGPAGEVLYLNEVRGSLPDYDLPIAESFVDQVFIVVLAAPDLDAALAHYVDPLGFTPGNEYNVPYSVINQAFSLPDDTPHRLSMACVGRRVAVEIDQYPQGTEERPCAEGALPPGLAMVSFTTERRIADLDHLVGPPVERRESPYGGRLAAVTLGAAGERIELIQA